MAKYVKLQIEIEAFKTREILYASSNDWSKLPECIREAYEKGDVLFLNNSIQIKTLEGDLLALADDFIIKGIKGELYPCKPDIFGMTYIKSE